MSKPPEISDNPFQSYAQRNPIPRPISRNMLQFLSRDWPLFQANFDFLGLSQDEWAALELSELEALFLAKNIDVIPVKTGRPGLFVRFSEPVCKYIKANGGAKFVREIVQAALEPAIGKPAILGWALVEQRKNASLWQRAGNYVATANAKSEPQMPADTARTYRDAAEAWAEWAYNCRPSFREQLAAKLARSPWGS